MHTVKWFLLSPVMALGSWHPSLVGFSCARCYSPYKLWRVTFSTRNHRHSVVTDIGLISDFWLVVAQRREKTESFDIVQRPNAAIVPLDCSDGLLRIGKYPFRANHLPSVLYPAVNQVNSHFPRDDPSNKGIPLLRNPSLLMSKLSTWSLSQWNVSKDLPPLPFALLPNRTR